MRLNVMNFGTLGTSSKIKHAMTLVCLLVKTLVRGLSFVMPEHSFGVMACCIAHLGVTARINTKVPIRRPCGSKFCSLT